MESWNDRPARVLDRALGHLGTWIVLALVSVVAALVAGVATHWARPTPSAWAVGLSLGLLALTLLAILWYSFETRRLAEIGSHPWLQVVGWPIPRQLEPVEKLLMGGEQAALPIMNVGRTPAQLTKISVAYEGPQNPVDAWVELGGDANPRVLAPGQQFLAPIVTIRGSVPSTRLHLLVTIEYQALQGGGGQVVVWLRYAGDMWKSQRIAYTATLAFGEVLSAQAIDEADADTAA